MVTNFALFFLCPDHKIKIWSQNFGFLRKVFWIFKNGQKKCPKIKIKNTFPNKFFDIFIYIILKPT